MRDADTTTRTAKFDWSRFDAMTDAEVHETALRDPDARPMTEEEFARAKRVPRIKTLRRALALTKEEFASKFRIPLATLRDWEQSRAKPDRTACAYLRAIAGDPEAVLRALAAVPQLSQSTRLLKPDVGAMSSISASRLADHFVNYLFHDHSGENRHVQQVASWLGFLILGLQKLKVQWRPYRSRQLVFEHGGRRFKARYNHQIKPRGGIEFVEVAAARGMPDLRVVRTIANLAEAADFYNSPKL